MSWWTRRVSAALQTLGPLRLGVDRIVDGHVEVGCGVDVDVAVAGAGLDDRDGRLLDDRRIREAPPRGMSTSTRPRARISSRTRSRPSPGHELDGVGRQARRRRRRRAAPDEGGVRLGGGAAAQQDRVAGLQAEGGGVDGDVRAGLVDDADHAERDADLAQVDAVGRGSSRARPRRPGRAARRRRARRRRSRRPAPGSRRQPVDDRLAGAGLAAAAMSLALAATISLVGPPARPRWRAARRPWRPAAAARGRRRPAARGRRPGRPRTSCEGDVGDAVACSKGMPVGHRAPTRAVTVAPPRRLRRRLRRWPMTHPVHRVTGALRPRRQLRRGLPAAAPRRRGRGRSHTVHFSTTPGTAQWRGP